MNVKSKVGDEVTNMEILERVGERHTVMTAIQTGRIFLLDTFYAMKGFLKPSLKIVEGNNVPVWQRKQYVS